MGETEITIHRAIRGINLWVIVVKLPGIGGTISDPGDFWAAWRHAVLFARYLREFLDNPDNPGAYPW